MTLDIIFIGFLVLSAIAGYMKGFITRLYDIVSLILVIYISFYFSKPLSHMIDINPAALNNPAVTMVSQLLNQIIVFIILLVGLFIVKIILGIILNLY